MRTVVYRDSVDFSLDRASGDMAFFVLGVRKSGSSVLNAIVQALAERNGLNYVDVAGKLFSAGVPVSTWQQDAALSEILAVGNVYGGFRNNPTAFTGAPLFRHSPKVLLVRDPRDALVSEYFSNAYSHSIPAAGEAREQMLSQRATALLSDIDDYVVKMAPDLRRVLREYRDVARLPNCLLFRYEKVIFDKPRLMRDICAFFGWSIGDAEVATIMQWADVVPAEEDPTRFIRHVTPGDHRAKLKPRTIAQLDDFFQEEMDFYDYPRQERPAEPPDPPAGTAPSGGAALADPEGEPAPAPAAGSQLPPPTPPASPLAEVLLRLYGRAPTQDNVDRWSEKVAAGLSAQAFIEHVTKADPFIANKQVRVQNQAGHYFSPVVDPDTIRDYYEMSSRTKPGELGGIVLPLDDMIAFWKNNQEFIAATPFGHDPKGPDRYYYDGGPYHYGDAIALRAMIRHYRPARAIEIGSGFTSACMLDSAGHAGLEFQLTCIEPDPWRLKNLLRAGDEKRVRLFERRVQGLSLDLFRELEANDILLIDSTHVLKTGSDVHYELFHILPVLKPGVLIHFHDCRYPFEYSVKQVFEKNHSWNEAYAVRALLMYSTRFRIVFWGSYFARVQAALVARTCPMFLQNTGSALWVQVQAEAPGLGRRPGPKP